MPQLVADDSLLIGVETRTSAPVRVERRAESLESTSTRGLYPVGEGAGHAGGIMTSAVDGVRCAEALLQKYDGGAGAAAAAAADAAPRRADDDDDHPGRRRAPPHPREHPDSPIPDWLG
jgi:CubicO group peptidase (beta-lactamase class C family)